MILGKYGDSSTLGDTSEFSGSRAVLDPSVVKSPSLFCKRMFAGLRSRWMMPF